MGGVRLYDPLPLKVMLPYVPPVVGYLLPALKIMHPGASDACIAGDGEAATFDDVDGAATSVVRRAVARDSDPAVDAGLDRGGRIPA